MNSRFFSLTAIALVASIALSACSGSSAGYKTDAGACKHLFDTVEKEIGPKAKSGEISDEQAVKQIDIIMSEISDNTNLSADLRDAARDVHNAISDLPPGTLTSEAYSHAGYQFAETCKSLGYDPDAPENAK